jgi:ribonuclease R
MAKAIPITGEGVLRHIAGLPQARANFKQLVRELGAKGKLREQLETVLEQLTGRGDLVELRNGQYAGTAQSPNFFTGRLQIHRDGYGFLITDRPLEGIQGDIFLPPETAARAMHGDRVLVELARLDSRGRAEGRILRILERAHATIVGEFRLGRRGNYVVPHDDRIRQTIMIPAGFEFPPQAESVDRIGVTGPGVKTVEDLDGMIVNLEVLAFPSGDTNGTGRVVEILGDPDDFGVDVEIIIRKHHIPHRFPPEVLAQAESYNPTIHEAELRRRQDFRGLDVVTIDGETARDFDDAVWVDRLANGHFTLQVHIADVGHYVNPGSPIDREARLRGASVYFPDRAVPMLPLQLSTELCSLKPGVDRLTLSVLLEIDNRGDTVAAEFTRGVIRSAERMTYTAVHAALEGDAATRERYERLIGRFELMRELAMILNARRVRRGSIDFDLPEPLIEFDEWGMMVGIARTPRNIAHRIIEEFMLAANEAVAGHLESSGLPLVFRVHEPPDPQRVLDFEEIAAHFGHSLGVGPTRVERFRNVQRGRDGSKVRRDIEVPAALSTVTSRDYQKLVARIEGRPEERIVTYLMLRSMKQARYAARNTGHFALAAPSYTHFTSPIRRYPDLLVHRALAAWLDGERGSTSAPAPSAGGRKRRPIPEPEPDPARTELAAAADGCSLTERRADEAERELLDWKKIKFMTGKLGDEFDALVISVNRFGLSVELTDLFVEGFVPIESLAGDRYLFRENQRKLVSRTGHEIRLGDRVRVRLDRVDAAEHKLEFSILGLPGMKGRSKGRPPGF